MYPLDQFNFQRLQHSMGSHFLCKCKMKMKTVKVSILCINLQTGSSIKLPNFLENSRNNYFLQLTEMYWFSIYLLKVEHCSRVDISTSYSLLLELKLHTTNKKQAHSYNILYYSPMLTNKFNSYGSEILANQHRKT